MKHQKPQNSERKKFEWTYIESIFSISSALIVFVPLLLTRSWGLPSFKDTGPIGDTIGGTTAPFIGLLSSWLVYRALKAQIDANKIITDQFKEQKRDEHSKKLIEIVTDQLTLLREDIKDYSFTERSGGMDYKKEGKDGIRRALDAYPKGHSDYNKVMREYDSRINEIKYFLGSIEYLLRTTDGAEINTTDKQYLIRIIQEVYTTRLYIGLVDNEYKRSSKQDFCDKCREQHGIPEVLYQINDAINQILYKYGYQLM